MPRAAVKRTTFTKRKPKTSYAARQQVFQTSRPPVPPNYSKGELKFHDVDLDDAVITQAGTITASISLIAGGTTESTRIGRKCTITNINWRFDIVMNDTGTVDNTSEAVRVMMYQDHQTNGAAAVALDILETDDYQSFNNLSNKNRFTILFDKTYDMVCPSGAGQNAADAFGETICSDAMYKKVMIPLEWAAQGALISNLRSNNIGVMLLSKSGNLTTFASKIRLRFSDS